MEYQGCGERDSHYGKRLASNSNITPDIHISGQKKTSLMILSSIGTFGKSPTKCLVNTGKHFEILCPNYVGGLTLCLSTLVFTFRSRLLKISVEVDTFWCTMHMNLPLFFFFQIYELCGRISVLHHIQSISLSEPFHLRTNSSKIKCFEDASKNKIWGRCIKKRKCFEDASKAKYEEDVAPGMLPKGTPRQDMSRMSTGACNIQIENSQLENCMFGIENCICEVLTENEN